MLFLMTGERVSNLHMLTLNRFQENMTVKTEKGTEVAADLVVLCTGIKINSAAYSSAFGKLKPQDRVGLLILQHR